LRNKLANSKNVRTAKSMVETSFNRRPMDVESFEVKTMNCGRTSSIWQGYSYYNVGALVSISVIF